MSLKAIHIVFITASTLLAFGFAAWSINHFYSSESTRMDLVLGASSALTGLVLIGYGKYFLRKLKNVEYL